MKKYFLRSSILIVPSIALILSGCVVADAPPNYDYGTPAFVIPPTIVTGRGYGYWYSGRYWRYHHGYAFYNGRYYRHRDWY